MASGKAKLFTYMLKVSTYSSISDINLGHLAFEKKNYSIQDSLSCPTHLWEEKNSVQDVLIMSYPFMIKKILSKMFLSKSYPFIKFCTYTTLISHSTM